ncbi:MAG: 4Fe-4S ferredoxin [Deltaproteobacteria bacterium]|nr:MAG: 4Fe-4S ferredoxin [Deltaproteobacteria bacterium]
MSFNICPVKKTLDDLTHMINTGGFPNAKCRRLAEEAQMLLKDISFGMAGNEHYSSLVSLASQLNSEEQQEKCSSAGSMLAVMLETHREVFISHIESKNCATEDCIRIRPAPCQMACPAGIDVPSYVTLIGQGKDAEAIELIRKDNPFPWICGLVCTHPCEFMCVRGRVDQPIAIKDLKGFAAERAMSDELYVNPEKGPENNRKVCIIGAGPAGLTAAYYLALRGYAVTVIDALPVAGGMMMVGIPRYRLPREVIDREVAMIEDLGVEFRLNTKIGVDVTLEELKQEGFEAILIAIGAHSSYKLRIPGEDDYPQVIDAITFLRNVALGERRPPGKKVAVIGGGNVAMDAARTAIRLGCRQVTVLYRRSRADMPANIEEVEQAEEEGVQFLFLTVPLEIKGENGKIKSLVCQRTELGPPDDSGRRRPVPVEGSEFQLEVDAVIPAIGQVVDHTGLEELSDLKWTRRDTISVATATMQTDIEGVFAAGDVVSGPATVVEAIGGGKRAAEAIDRYLLGLPQPEMPPIPIRRARLECIEVPATTKMTLRRPEMPMLSYERRRVTFQQAELGLPESKVREEARRCLRCDICVRCGTCQEVCRKMGINALEMGYLDFDHPGHTDFRVAAERCILCGACAANCPTGAMRIEDKGDERILYLCGTVLNRLKVEKCEICGKVIGTERYHDFVTKKLEGLSPHLKGHLICLDCARKKAAEGHVEISPPPPRFIR